MTINEKDLNDITMAMYLQVRWCRGQVLATHRQTRAKPLLFAIEHNGADQWSFHDLDYEPGHQVKSEVIQGAIWERNAIGVFECTDQGQHYYGLLYQMTGIVRGYKSTLNAARRSYERYAVEECSARENIGRREITINTKPFAPEDWLKSFNKLLSREMNKAGPNDGLA